MSYNSLIPTAVGYYALQDNEATVVELSDEFVSGSAVGASGDVPTGWFDYTAAPGAPTARTYTGSSIILQMGPTVAAWQRHGMRYPIFQANKLYRATVRWRRLSAGTGVVQLSAIAAFAGNFTADVNQAVIGEWVESSLTKEWLSGDNNLYVCLQAALTGAAAEIEIDRVEIELLGSQVINANGGLDGKIVGQAGTGEISTAGPRSWLPAALQFADDKNYVLIGNVPEFATQNNATIAAWVKPSVLEYNNHWATLGNAHADLAIEGAGRPKIWDGTQEARPAVNLSVGAWSHLVVTLSETAGTWYFNGVADPVAWVPRNNTITPSLRIGFRGGGGLADSWKGDIAGVAFFDRPLSGSEVAELYAGPEPLNILPPTIRGLPLIDALLICDPGSWDTQNNGSLTYSYQWRRDGADIPGATQHSYRTTEDDANSVITCVVAASNDGGADPAEATESTEFLVGSATRSYNKLATLALSHWKLQDQAPVLPPVYVNDFTDGVDPAPSPWGPTPLGWYSYHPSLDNAALQYREYLDGYFRLTFTQTISGTWQRIGFGANPLAANTRYRVTIRWRRLSGSGYVTLGFVGSFSGTVVAEVNNQPIGEWIESSVTAKTSGPQLIMQLASNQLNANAVVDVASFTVVPDTAELVDARGNNPGTIGHLAGSLTVASEAFSVCPWLPRSLRIDTDVNRYVSIPLQGQLTATNPWPLSFTFGSWYHNEVGLSNPLTQYGRLFAFGSGAHGFESIGQNVAGAAYLSFGAYTAGIARAVLGINNSVAGQTKHLAVSWDAVEKTARGYENGQLAGTTPVTITDPIYSTQAADSRLFGYNAGGITNSLSGLHAETLLFDVVLADEDLLEIYQGPEAINLTLPQITGSTSIGSTLTCDPGTWDAQNNGDITYSYQWLRNNVLLPGATTNQYTIQLADSGATFSCRVIATNNGGSDPAETVFSPDFVLPVYTAPANDTPPSVTGDLDYGDTLVCDPGSWSASPGTGTITYSYQWLRNGVPIPRATSSVYTIHVGDRAKQLSCRVAASNLVGTDPAETTTSDAVTVSMFAVHYQRVLESAAASWDLQEAANSAVLADARGNYPATLQGGKQTIDASAAGPRAWLPQAIQLSGTDYITAAAEIGSQPQDFSLAGWFYVDADAAASTLWSNRDGAGTYDITRDATGRISNDPGTVYSTNTGVLPRLAWRHVAYVVRDGLGQFYVNGAAAGVAHNYTPAASTQLFTIGRRANANQGYLTGRVAGVQLYDFALATSEITELVSGPEPLNVGPPSIVGLMLPNSILSVNPGQWDLQDNPPVLTYTFQWYRNGVAVPGATSSTFLVPSDAVGDFISVAVDAITTGGLSLTGPAMSAPVPVGEPLRVVNRPDFTRALADLPEGYNSLAWNTGRATYSAIIVDGSLQQDAELDLTAGIASAQAAVSQWSTGWTGAADNAPLQVLIDELHLFTFRRRQ